jgi:hypothetical protein
MISNNHKKVCVVFIAYIGSFLRMMPIGEVRQCKLNINIKLKRTFFSFLLTMLAHSSILQVLTLQPPEDSNSCKSIFIKKIKY